MADVQVVFYEAFEEEVQALKGHLGSDIHAAFTWKTVQEAGHAAPPAPLISIRTQSQVPDSWISSLGGLLSRSTGHDHLLPFLGRVACGHLPLYCHRAVAEQAMMLWMALLRKLPRQLDQLAAFHRDGLTGRECQGKTLLVVGVGHIGYEVARIGRGLGMRVLGHDVVRRHADIDYVDLDQGLAQADIVVCAMNLTDENRGFFRSAALQKMPRGGLFINIARGELSPTADLLALLENGHLGGVGLDVFEDEGAIAVARRQGKSTPESDLLQRLADHPQALCTPHNAFNTAESVARKSEHSAMQIRHYIETGRFLWPVPLTPIREETDP